MAPEPTAMLETLPVHSVLQSPTVILTYVRVGVFGFGKHDAVDRGLPLGLHTAAGRRTISEVIEELARPIVPESHLEAAYREMSLDEDREREASEWIEGLIHDPFPGGQLGPR